MAVVHVLCWIIFLSTISALPEIPSKDTINRSDDNGCAFPPEKTSRTLLALPALQRFITRVNSLESDDATGLVDRSKRTEMAMAIPISPLFERLTSPIVTTITFKINWHDFGCDNSSNFMLYINIVLNTYVELINVGIRKNTLKLRMEPK
uniref:Uncharacterized protein n=1 Tax=Glossina pallidipes TaxID=7398 RepID=A0A1A9ZHU8_GLOPL